MSNKTTTPNIMLRENRHEKRKIKDLIPADYNPRKISSQALSGLKKSIEEFGCVQPIIINEKTGVVVGGHQRIKAMQELGVEEADVIIVNLTEIEEKTLNIALNNSAISGEFTIDLNSILEEIKINDVQMFDSLMLNELWVDEIPDKKTFNGDEDDCPAEDEVEPIAKVGDMWQLGKHRLLCGDSTKKEDVERLMLGELADMVFTDPPYGVDYGAKNRLLNTFQKSGRNLRDVANDMLSKDELLNFLVLAFTLANEFGADHCSYYVTAPQNGELSLMMMMMMMMSGLPTKHVLIWNKNKQVFSLGRLDYEYKHEPILYTWKKTHKFYGKGEHKNSVWDVAKEQKCDIHPTMKPVALIENALLNSSNTNDIVLDIFGGSGSTLIACEKNGRQCRMIELEPHYCDVIIKRWEDFTSKKAELLKQ